jgi:SNF2 family DNA or RNA helicase
VLGLGDEFAKNLPFPIAGFTSFAKTRPAPALDCSFLPQSEATDGPCPLNIPTCCFSSTTTCFTISQTITTFILHTSIICTVIQPPHTHTHTHTMEDSQEPPLAEFIPIEPTEMPLNLTDDIQMAETDHLVNNSESMLDEPKSEASVSEAYVRYTTAAEPTSPSHDKEPSSQNISLSIESAVLIDSGQSSFGQPTPSLNLGASSLSKPASQVSREKARERARATQALLVQQYTAKNNAASAPSASVNLSDAGEPAASLDHGSAEADSEMAAFEKLKAAHEIKKQAGTSDIETDVTYLKAEAKEMARRRKLEADELYELNRSEDEDDDESETLFVTGNTPASRATGTPASHATGTPKRPRVPGGKRRAADKSMAPPKKRAKTTNEPTGRSLARRKDGKGLTNDEYERTLQAMNSKQGASKKQPAKSKPGHNISNVASLLNGTDVFRDTNDVADRSNQPAFAAGITHRDKALRALIASVPQEEQGLAAGDKKLLENSLKDFTGQGSCKPSPDGTGWTLRGMNCTLKHYQVLGIAFMRKRETQKVRPRGGILADEMGLGKTIQMIANIINGKPNAGEPKTTLIVASPALVGQWHAEILKFTQTKKENKKHGISRIIQHRAGYRQGGDHDQIKEAIEASDICLTTYSEVQRSYPKNIVPPEITTERAKQIWWSDYFANNKGVFHDIKFHRVILDEAQTIKNHTGQCSMACRALNSEFSWAITGTPLVNGIREMYPYLKFLKHPHAGSMRTFEANFCAPNDPTGAQKLGVFLKQIIIRRTHKDLLFGARLLDLPTPKQNVIYLEFNGVERSVYEIVKQRFIQRINTITKRVGIQAQYSCVWTMLLRLRQICSHIFLIQDTIMDLLEREDFEKLNDITKEVEGESKENSDMLARLSHMLKTHRALVMQAGPANAEAAGVDVHVVPGGHNNMNVGNASDLGGRHGKTYAFGKLLESAAKTDQMAAIKARAKCCSCRELPYDAQSKTT